MSSVKFEERSETLIKEYFRPPVAGNQISEPLMSKFMSNNCGDVLFDCI